MGHEALGGPPVRLVFKIQADKELTSYVNVRTLIVYKRYSLSLKLGGPPIQLAFKICLIRSTEDVCLF